MQYALQQTDVYFSSPKCLSQRCTGIEQWVQCDHGVVLDRAQLRHRKLPHICHSLRMVGVVWVCLMRVRSTWPCGMLLFAERVHEMQLSNMCHDKRGIGDGCRTHTYGVENVGLGDFNNTRSASELPSGSNNENSVMLVATRLKSQRCCPALCANTLVQRHIHSDGIYTGEGTHHVLHHLQSPWPPCLRRRRSHVFGSTYPTKTVLFGWCRHPS